MSSLFELHQRRRAVKSSSSGSVAIARGACSARGNAFRRVFRQRTGKTLRRYRGKNAAGK